jgi:hypothetical protein
MCQHWWQCSRGAWREISRRRRTGELVSMARDLLTMFGAFVLASALAGALGAPNLGTALAFGQIAFAVAVVYVLLKR